MSIGDTESAGNHLECPWHTTCNGVDMSGFPKSITWQAMRTLLTLLTVVAAYGCSQENAASFSDVDANGDGRISEQEAQADSVLARRFAMVDADRDGELSASEYLQGATALR